MNAANANRMDSIVAACDSLAKRMDAYGERKADADFKEGDHPRAKDGKFGSGGSSGSGSKPSKPLAGRLKTVPSSSSEAYKVGLAMGKDRFGESSKIDRTEPSAYKKSLLASGATEEVAEAFRRGYSGMTESKEKQQEHLAGIKERKAAGAAAFKAGKGPNLNSGDTGKDLDHSTGWHQARSAAERKDAAGFGNKIPPMEHNRLPRDQTPLERMRAMAEAKQKAGG